MLSVSQRESEAALTTAISEGLSISIITDSTDTIMEESGTYAGN